jgi:GH35 family endo-1,4-beta-xylanase
MKAWKSWVNAVSQRYGASIDAYQIWNEANLADFYQGTPKEMAQLTREAYKIIRRNDPTAKVVSASSTVRLESAYQRFFPAYLKELKKMGWPIDVISFHTYPQGTGTPADREQFIELTRADMKQVKVPGNIPLWDTEINARSAGTPLPHGPRRPTCRTCSTASIARTGTTGSGRMVASAS